MKKFTQSLSVFTLAAIIATGVTLATNKADTHNSSSFQGQKANTGMVAHFYEGGKSLLKVSDDFRVPDTPAPTWRIVDSKGIIYTLDAFKIKGGEKRQVVVPAYVKDIAKVQVYCAYAEVLLGESSFAPPVK